MPSKASGVASSTVMSAAVDGQVGARGARRGEEPQLRVRELLLEEDLDHGPTDGAGGADDGDGELLGAGFGHGPTC